MYKSVPGGCIRMSDGAYIPADPRNVDFGAYKRWLDQGNIPLPPDAPDPNATILAQIDAIERRHLMNRGEREGWITILLEKAETLGKTEADLMDPETGNPFFRKLREVDNQIKALRGQLQ